MYQWFIYVVRQNTVTSLPASFIYLGAESILGIQVVVPFMIIVSLALSIVMRKTRFGNYIYAVGGNPQAATMLGINTKGIVFAVFVLSGFFSGMTGLLYAGFVQSVSVELTNGLVFTAFAGAVLGGISLKGGSGKISNAYGGIVLMGTIQAGSHMLLLPPEWVGILTGALILGAILLNQARERIRKRLLMPVE
jgi:simple sugar transport system permease protein